MAVQGNGPNQYGPENEGINRDENKHGFNNEGEREESRLDEELRGELRSKNKENLRQMKRDDRLDA